MAEEEAQHFRDIADAGNEDPWGLAYRKAVGRVKAPSNVIGCLKVNGRCAEDVDGVIQMMLEALLPCDDASTDSGHHSQIRAMARIAPTGEPAPPIGRECLGR
ncbi:hypothetical protein EVAR_67879_1 [Eumeta japonica]|uniref:Uncharacterized protein n=1 Tax=Eumeta variegata TaxID=151549 RepID=A0A4C2A8L3_EUMVA|nr:hypothetical protein EVAR_67879_1 [Eumeta japonica]